MQMSLHRRPCLLHRKNQKLYTLVCRTILCPISLVYLFIPYHNYYYHVFITIFFSIVSFSSSSLRGFYPIPSKDFPLSHILLRPHVLLLVFHLLYYFLFFVPFLYVVLLLSVLVKF